MIRSTSSLSTSQLENYTIRPPRLEDAPEILELYIRMDRADSLSWAGNLQEVKDDFSDPGANAETDALLVIAPDGRIAGLGWVFLNQEAARERRAFLWGVVHPDHRQRGLGHTVLNWLEARGNQRLGEYQEDLPHFLVANSADYNLDRTVLYEQHGFEQKRFYFRMRRDLSQPIPEKPVPMGIEIRPFTPEMDEPARVVVNASFQDHWGFEPITSESWKLHVTGADTFRPNLTFAAFAGERMVGISINRENAEDNARVGIHEGWIGTLGVLRDQRGKGLATSLLCRSMQAFKAAGMGFAGLTVDTENLSGALRLYENLAFTSVTRYILWKKPAQS